MSTINIPFIHDDYDYVDKQSSHQAEEKSSGYDVKHLIQRYSQLYSEINNSNESLQEWNNLISQGDNRLLKFIAESVAYVNNVELEIIALKCLLLLCSLDVANYYPFLCTNQSFVHKLTATIDPTHCHAQFTRIQLKFLQSLLEYSKEFDKNLFQHIDAEDLQSSLLCCVCLIEDNLISTAALYCLLLINYNDIIQNKAPLIDLFFTKEMILEFPTINNNSDRYQNVLAILSQELISTINKGSLTLVDNSAEVKLSFVEDDSNVDLSVSQYTGAWGVQQRQQQRQKVIEQQNVEEQRISNPFLFLAALDFVSSVFHHGTHHSDFFYTTDINVLIDILMQKIEDMTANQTFILELLLALSAIINWPGYEAAQQSYKLNEMRQSITSVLQQYNNADESNQIEAAIAELANDIQQTLTSLQ
jgi:hypothetical protein